jgi:hypothetical protein
VPPWHRIRTSLCIKRIQSCGTVSEPRRDELITHSNRLCVLCVVCVVGPAATIGSLSCVSRMVCSQSRSRSRTVGHSDGKVTVTVLVTVTFGGGNGAFMLAKRPEGKSQEQPIPNPLSPSIPAQGSMRSMRSMRGSHCCGFSCFWLSN